VQTARISFVLACAMSVAYACSPSRDTVPETKDVHVVAGADAGASATYRFVARRPHGAIGIAGTKNIGDDDARRFVEHLADELEACATRLQETGSLVLGAARMVVASGAKGNAEIGDTELQPGSGIAANALLCIVAPARATPFPSAGSAGIPAILIEATWSPVHGGNALLPRDAGSGIGSDL
jgi:hypothetical protein